MFLLVLTIRSASHHLTKAVRADDPCGSDFWYERVMQASCMRDERGYMFWCKGRGAECNLTLTPTDFNWTMGCAFSTQYCRFEFSRSWFMDGPGGESARCVGECVDGLQGKFIGLLIYLGVLGVGAVGSVSLWIYMCHPRRKVARVNADESQLVACGEEVQLMTTTV
jgi:hypothetical protein